MEIHHSSLPSSRVKLEVQRGREAETPELFPHPGGHHLVRNDSACELWLHSPLTIRPSATEQYKDSHHCFYDAREDLSHRRFCEHRGRHFSGGRGPDPELGLLGRSKPREVTVVFM